METVFRAPPPANLFPSSIPPGYSRERYHGIAALAASDEWLAFDRYVTEVEHYGGPEARALARSSSYPRAVITAGEFQAGPLRGPFERLAGGIGLRDCTAEGGVGEVELYGSVLAYTESVPGCEGQPGALRVVVKNLAAAESPPRVFPRISSGPGEVTVAGRYIAWVPSVEYTGKFTMVLADWSTGQVLMRFNPRGDARVNELALTPQGRLYFTYRVEVEDPDLTKPPKGRDHLAWISLGERVTHHLDSAPRIAGLQAQDGRIAYLRGGRRRDGSYPRVFRAPRSQLVVRRAGSSPAVVAHFGGRKTIAGGPDIGHGRIAWAEGTLPRAAKSETPSKVRIRIRSF